MRMRPDFTPKPGGAILLFFIFILLSYLVIIPPLAGEAHHRVNHKKGRSLEPLPSSSESVSSLSFTAAEGGANPQSQTFTISNTGGGTLSWSITDDAGWLSVNPTSGTTTTETDTITVSVDITGLSANTYTATITISTPGAIETSQQIPVTLYMLPPAPTIGASPASLSFVGTAGGSNPIPQTLNITNTGKGTLTWSANDDAAWLSLSMTSGTTTTETDQIQVSVNTSNLTAGTYTATITLSDPAASNNPQSVPVTLALTAPASGTAMLTWDANTESDLAGYKVYVGTRSRTYGPPLDVGKVTSFKVINLLPGTTYYFAVTAYDTASNESGFSNEVSKSIP